MAERRKFIEGKTFPVWCNKIRPRPDNLTYTHISRHSETFEEKRCVITNEKSLALSLILYHLSFLFSCLFLTFSFHFIHTQYLYILFVEIDAVSFGIHTK